MANLLGTIRRMCPYCCDDIEPGQAYEVAKAIGSPIDGIAVHATCARLREFANEPKPLNSQITTEKNL